MGPLVPDWETLSRALREPLRMARYPFGLARFGLKAMLSSQALTEAAFQGGQARGFFSGMAAHSMLPLEQSPSAAFGLALGIAGHAVGWPLPRGGSQQITDALVAYLRSLGGEVVTGGEVKSLANLPPSRAVLCATSRHASWCGSPASTLPPATGTRLSRYRYGLGVFKLDWALDGPIPWKSPDVARAATVHLGGTLEEIALRSGRRRAAKIAEAPYVLLAQPRLFDPTRAPAASTPPGPTATSPTAARWT